MTQRVGEVADERCVRAMWSREEERMLSRCVGSTTGFALGKEVEQRNKTRGHFGSPVFEEREGYTNRCVMYG